MKGARVVAVAAAVAALALLLHPSRDREPARNPGPIADGAARTADRASEPVPAVSSGPAAVPNPSEPPSADSATPPADSSIPSLEKLLTWTDPPPPRGIDLGSSVGAQQESDAPTRSGKGRRISLDRRSEDLPAKRRHETTDVGVRVPLDDSGSVSVKGGVRIESREDGEKREQEHTPTVGVDVSF